MNIIGELQNVMNGYLKYFLWLMKHLCKFHFLKFVVFLVSFIQILFFFFLISLKCYQSHSLSLLGVTTGRFGSGLCLTHDQPNQIELKTSKLATDRSEIRVGSDGSSSEGGRVSVRVGSGRNWLDLAENWANLAEIR